MTKTLKLNSDPIITISDKIFVQMRSDIVEGVIDAGSKLSETHLSNYYSVGRSVIREAINRLVACHLVERKANIGAKVVELNLESLQSLYEIREPLEGMAARLAAENMSDTEINDLNTLLSTHFKSIQDNQHYYQEAGDVDFHFRIMQGSKNSHLISVLFDGIYHLIRMYRVQLGMAGSRVTSAFDEHKQIVQAIANRDPELAEILMRRHIVTTKKSLVNKLAKEKLPKNIALTNTIGNQP